MGRRKFRLFRRKRYQYSHLSNTSLMVQEHCSWDTLCKNIKEAELGCWSYVSTGDDHTITLSTFSSSNPPIALMTITIFSSSTHDNWNLHVGHRCMSRFDHLPATIHSVADLLTILDTINKFNLCTGINDKKFTPLIKCHNGDFYNQQGEYIFILAT